MFFLVLAALWLFEYSCKFCSPTQVSSREWHPLNSSVYSVNYLCIFSYICVLSNYHVALRKREIILQVLTYQEFRKLINRAMRGSLVPCSWPQSAIESTLISNQIVHHQHSMEWPGAACWDGTHVPSTVIYTSRLVLFILFTYPERCEVSQSGHKDLSRLKNGFIESGVFFYRPKIT